jgi:hypothetical protein
VPRRDQAALVPNGEQLVAPQRLTAGQPLHGQLPCVLEDRNVEPELSAAGGGPSHNARSREVQHPGEVLGHDQVKGAAHRPRLDDLASVERGLDPLAGT